MSHDFSDVAALFSDPGRSAMLIALMDGRALPAGQLAMIANVAPQTASSHLTKLVDGQLLAVEPQGRHRYYRLAGSEVAHAIEALLAITPRANEAVQKSAVRRAPDDALAYARTCYSHLAGRLAVNIVDALQHRGLLDPRREPTALRLRSAAATWFAQLGIEITVTGDEGSTLYPPLPGLDRTTPSHRRTSRFGDAGALPRAEVDCTHARQPRGSRDPGRRTQTVAVAAGEWKKSFRVKSRMRSIEH